VVDLIDAARVKLDAGAFRDQPLAAESLIRFRLGNLIKDLGYPERAVPHLERVREIYLEHGITPPNTGASYDGNSRHLVMNYLALAYLRSGEREKAEALFQQIIEEKEETNHIYTNLYPWVKCRAAEIYRMKAQYMESERILLEMMQPQFRNGEGLPKNYLARCMCDLAETYRGQGRYEQAERMYGKARDVIERQDINGVAPSMGLARLHSDLGRYSEEEELLRAEIERIPREHPGKDHVGMIQAMNRLAVVLTRKRDFDEAERLFAEVWKVRREKWTDDHPATLATINDFGVLRREQKRYAEAESLLRQALEGRQQKLGPDHPACFESMRELGILYLRQARYEDAEPLLLDAFHGREAKLGPEHPHTLESLKQLVTLYESWPKPAEAAKWRAKLPRKEDTRE
jgi:tetratricopeptide (TPR) repeat protein